ncbi:hypothetical protein THAOC_36190 [Thalassiosira oceanica]|uniref:Leucine-rich repeat protein n=1 Tax=Thalassiosira oceanica TaxID=159749 RepID=K0R276_THAOC|nr:hypothetical protein THAOC_36190 [Thalassiosira oceanica]|eukprot:EJK45204.1 hypothetical protein THAOC_36190 [Thalassiosira oceanica]
MVSSVLTSVVCTALQHSTLLLRVRGRAAGLRAKPANGGGTPGPEKSAVETVRACIRRRWRKTLNDSALSRRATAYSIERTCVLHARDQADGRLCEGEEEPFEILPRTERRNLVYCSRVATQIGAHHHEESLGRKHFRTMDGDDARGRKRNCDPKLDSFFLYEGGEVAEELKSQITRIRIGPQVKDIPRDAFRGCINLAEVQFDEGSLEVIGDHAFRGCEALQEVVIPPGVTKLGSNAFLYCTNLAEVQFHEGLEIIGQSAFQDCKALQQVILPSSVTLLGSEAFWGCSNLAAVKLNEGLEIIRMSTFGLCRAIQRVTVPLSVTKLDTWAFSGCGNLASVQFSEGLEIISERAFNECTTLRSVTVPSSVTELGYGAFTDCTNLTEVIILGGERLLNQGFLKRGLFSGRGVLNQQALSEMIGDGNSLRDCPATNAFNGCPLTNVKISIPRALSERVERLPRECRLSIEQRVHNLRRLELTQDGNILVCFPLIRGPSGWNIIEDANDETAESLHQILRLISFHELKESSILIELAMWKSRLVEDRARANCRASVPDPAKSLIIDYCGFTCFLEPAIEGD